MRQRKIAWVERQFGEGWEDIEPDVVQWVDVALLDAAWARTPERILPGGGSGQGDRYRNFGAWLKQGRPVEMCVVWVTDDAVGFTNGRHRFSWLRDHGVVALPIQISPASVVIVEPRFGT